MHVPITCPRPLQAEFNSKFSLPHVHVYTLVTPLHLAIPWQQTLSRRMILQVLKVLAR